MREAPRGEELRDLDLRVDTGARAPEGFQDQLPAEGHRGIALLPREPLHFDRRRGAAVWAGPGHHRPTAKAPRPAGDLAVGADGLEHLHAERGIGVALDDDP
jgi:hypothetical protein